MPNEPLNVQVNRVQLSAPCTHSVSWDMPDNNEKFDLEHYKIHIMLPEQERYIANGTSMEPEYHFHSDMIQSQNSNIHVTVTAISKCSQQSLSSPRVEWREDTLSDIKAVVTNDPGTISKTKSGLEESKHNIMMSGK